MKDRPRLPPDEPVSQIFGSWPNGIADDFDELAAGQARLRDQSPRSRARPPTTLRVRLTGKQTVDNAAGRWVEYAWESVEAGDDHAFTTTEDRPTSGVYEGGEVDEFGNPAFNLAEVPLAGYLHEGLEISEEESERPVVTLTVLSTRDGSTVRVFYHPLAQANAVITAVTGSLNATYSARMLDGTASVTDVTPVNRLFSVADFNYAPAQVGHPCALLLDADGAIKLFVFTETIQVTECDESVAGPNESTGHAAARFADDTGKLIEDSPVTIDDDGDVAGVRHLLATGMLTAGGLSGNASKVVILNVDGQLQAAAYMLADFVLKSLFDANTILYAATDNTPAALAIAASRIVGRKATGGIAALTGAEVRAIANVIPTSAATFSCDELTWADMPEAPAEVPGAARHTVDLTNSSQVRLSVNLTTAGAAAATLYAQYYDGGWLTLTGTVSLAAAGHLTSSWSATPAGAKADVPVRIAGQDGDEIIDPVFHGIELQVK